LAEEIQTVAHASPNPVQACKDQTPHRAQAIQNLGEPYTITAKNIPSEFKGGIIAKDEFQNSVLGVGLAVPGDNDGIVFEKEPEVVAINGTELQYDLGNVVFDPNDHARSPGQNIEFSGSNMDFQLDEDTNACDASHPEIPSESYGNVVFRDEMGSAQMNALDDEEGLDLVHRSDGDQAPSSCNVDFENRLMGISIPMQFQSESSPRDDGNIVFEKEPESVSINGSELGYDLGNVVFDQEDDHARSPGQSIEYMSVCDAPHPEIPSDSYGNVVFGDENGLVGVGIPMQCPSELSPCDDGNIMFEKEPESISINGSKLEYDLGNVIFDSADNRPTASAHLSELVPGPVSFLF
jgi:hypothetical protein